MKNSAVLVDLTKCIGCGSCTVACKLWNDLEYSATGVEGNAHGFDAKLDQNSWCVVDYEKVTNKAGEEVLRFAKHQCMHCQHPACQTVCFADAIYVSKETGAVIYDPKKCVGCRYCMIACPYDVPKYEWDKIFPSVIKCQMCSSKIAAGEAPACTCVCPSNALIFGDRDEVLAEAKARIASNPNYIDYVYGENEVGGARWLYISDVPFEDLGFPMNLPTVPIEKPVHNFGKLQPAVYGGAAVILGGLGLYTRRRMKIAAEKKEKGGK